MAQNNYLTEQAGQYLSERIKERALIASPELTGTPKAPTAAAGTNTEQIATTAFVKKAVDDAVAGIYTPMGTVDGASDLPTDAEAGDIYTVKEETVVTEGTEGKNVVQKLSGTVDTYADLPNDATEVADGAIYKVVAPYSDTSTDPATEYEANSLWSASNDGTTVTWSNITGTAYPANTDYKYTEEDGWTPMESGVDLSNLVTKDELAEADYVKNEDLQPTPLSTVISWFSETPTTPEYTYTPVDDTTGKNPKDEGWYVKNGDEYELTEDETPQTGVEYYIRTEA